MSTKLGHPTAGSLPFSVPDWLSPARVMGLTAPLVRTVTLAAGVVTPIARANPARTSLLVIVPSGSALDCFVSPLKNVQDAGVRFEVGSPWLLVTLAEWQYWTVMEWSGYSAGGVTIQVGETYRTK